MAKSLLDTLSQMTIDDVGSEKTAAEVESYAEAMADCDYRDLEKLAFDLGLIAEDDTEEKTAAEDDEDEAEEVEEPEAEEAEEGEETDEDAAEVSEEEEEAEEAEDEAESEEGEAEEEADDEEAESEEEDAAEGEEELEAEAYTLTPDEFEKCAYEFLDSRMKTAGISVDDYVQSIISNEKTAHDIAATAEKLAYVVEASPFKVADDIIAALHEKIAAEESEDEE